MQALSGQLDAELLTELVPELRLARGVGQGQYHHLDVLDHILEVIRRIRRELEKHELDARVSSDNVDGLLLAGLLHDIAKPVTRGEEEGQVFFVSHDSLGARLAYRVCRRLGCSAQLTDQVTTLTALHLKIGFMGSSRTDYPPDRLARAAGPFGDELAVLSWADRLAAQGPKLEEEHIERHYALCTSFLEASRSLGLHPVPDYAVLAGRLLPGRQPALADAGYAASRIRQLEARGLDESRALEYAGVLLRSGASGDGEIGRGD